MCREPLPVAAKRGFMHGLQLLLDVGASVTGGRCPVWLRFDASQALNCGCQPELVIDQLISARAGCTAQLSRCGSGDLLL